ncbi:MAG: GGDEF domain-containing protein, partial [candidate division Zixibacteria bacterium]|nr:GGDEF domain-containing protein [candidate division Zixibacteria bacterium]
MDKSEQVISRRDLNRYLKIKNSQELVAELTKTLKKDGEFDKLAFYVNISSKENLPISVNLQVKDSIDRTLKENHDIILNELKLDEACNLNDTSSENLILREHLSNINGEINGLAKIPWINNQKAIIAWNNSNTKDNSKDYIQSFWRNAIPLIEYIGQYEKAREMSYTDGLTGVYNHRYFKKRLTEELQRAARYGRSLTLLILDVDDLKIVNDNYGHPAGDKLLR